MGLALYKFSKDRTRTDSAAEGAGKGGALGAAAGAGYGAITTKKAITPEMAKSLKAMGGSKAKLIAAGALGVGGLGALAGLGAGGAVGAATHKKD